MKFFRAFALAIFFFSSSKIIAQIGINTITPDSSASLHILSKPNGSGLIIPELTEAQRLAISKPAIGLMVYDVTSKLFYVNLNNTPGNHWFAINPTFTQGTTTTPDVMYTSAAVTKVGIGIQPPQVPQATLDVNGDIRANTAVSTNTLNVTGFPTNALIPSGIITMWSGDPTVLPAGWALCDGTTYGTFITPDLRGRFIVGFDKNASTTPATALPNGTTINYGKVGNLGGETGHLLDSLESGLPRHTPTSQPHQHQIASQFSKTETQAWPYCLGGGDCSAGKNFDQPTSFVTVTINSVPPQNASKPHENRPPYYVLAYIIKLP